MKNLTLDARLISAVLAAATTLGLFSTVVSFAEPQRGVLVAKSQRTNVPAAPIAVAVARDSVTQNGE